MLLRPNIQNSIEISSFSYPYHKTSIQNYQKLRFKYSNLESTEGKNKKTGIWKTLYHRFCKIFLFMFFCPFNFLYPSQLPVLFGKLCCLSKYISCVSTWLLIISPPASSCYPSHSRVTLVIFSL